MRRLRWAMAALGALGAAGSVFAADFQHPAYTVAAASAACLECHDGAVAPNIIAPVLATATRLSPGRGGAGHPVGIDYAAAQASRWAKLRPVPLLPPEIRLVDGRVECSSCHDLSTSGAARLVLGMARSRLCFACHDL